MLSKATALTVIVRDRVRRTLASWIDPILDYVLVELFVALLDESHEPAMGQSPDARPNNRTDEIS